MPAIDGSQEWAQYSKGDALVAACAIASPPADVRPMLPSSRLPATTGGAFVINGQIETDRIEIISGRLLATPMPTDSGRPHDIYRCAVCQTALWSDYGHRPALRFLRVATLTIPRQCVPVPIFSCAANCPGSNSGATSPPSTSITT